MKRTILSLIAITIISISVMAQSVSDMFINMPDSIMPYLNSAQRTELLKMYEIDSTKTATVNSLLQTEVKLNICTEHYISVLTDDGFEFEIARLSDDASSTQTFGMIKTVCAPEKSSKLIIVDNNWNTIDEPSFDYHTLLHKNDTISDDEYRKLCNYIEFPLIELHFNKDLPQILNISLNCPMLATEDKDKFDSIILQRNAKWDEKSFK